MIHPSIGRKFIRLGPVGGHTELELMRRRMENELIDIRRIWEYRAR